MKIFELFDKNPGHLVQSDSPRLFKTTSMIDGHLYVFVASLDYGNTWDVEFYEQEASTRMYGKTGHGKELDVFSFIKGSFEEFLQRYHPDAVEFTADKEPDDSSNNRARLYNRMVNRLFKGWDIHTINHDDTVFFRISKPEASE